MCSFKNRPFALRKSYRLVPETGIELIFLNAEADYEYRSLTPDEVERIIGAAATLCSEAGIWVAEGKLRPSLLEGWE